MRAVHLTHENYTALKSKNLLFLKTPGIRVDRGEILFQNPLSCQLNLIIII